MTTIGDNQRSRRVWGAAAIPGRPVSAGPPGQTDPDPDADTTRFAPVPAEPPIGLLGVEGWPEREPPRKHKRAPSRLWTGLRTAVVLVALVAAVATGGYLLLRQRLAAAAFVDRGTVTLTADPVPIGSSTRRWWSVSRWPPRTGWVPPQPAIVADGPVGLAFGDPDRPIRIGANPAATPRTVTFGRGAEIIETGTLAPSTPPRRPGHRRGPGSRA